MCAQADAVKAASAASFQLLLQQNTTKAALEALSAPLRGVGPATASAALAAADAARGRWPYMGDEALEVALGSRCRSSTALNRASLL